MDREIEEAKFQRDKRKWTIRRRFAISSFVQMSLLAVFYMLTPFLMDVETAKTFSQFNPIIITLIGFHSGIVMLYIGAVTYSDNVKDGILTTEYSTK